MEQDRSDDPVNHGVAEGDIIHSGMQALSEQTLDRPGQGQADARGKAIVFFSERQEDPAVLEDVQDGGKIPERRENEGDPFSDPAELGKNASGSSTCSMVCEHRTESKVAVLKGQPINRIDQDETGRRPRAGRYRH